MSIFYECDRFSDDNLPPRLSNYEYLLLSDRLEAKQTRELLERWLSMFPRANQESIERDVQSGDDVRFDSAVFELAVSAIIQLSGNEVLQVEPELGTKGRNPDFLCRTQTEMEFVVECADARHLSVEDEGRQKHLDDIINAINEIPADRHRIYFKYSDRPPRAVKKARVQEPISTWLGQLGDEADFGMGQQLEFEIDGINYSCEPMRAYGEVGRLVGAYGRSAMWTSSQPDSLRRSLKKKATRYGDLDRPYIIALNAPTSFHPHEDLFDVLFGSPAIAFDPNNPEEAVHEIRKNDGLWAGTDGWTNTRVTGVLLAANLGAWSAAARDLWYFEHPFAAHPVDPPFRSIARIGGDNGEISLREGTASSEIFGLNAA